MHLFFLFIYLCIYLFIYLFVHVLVIGFFHDSHKQAHTHNTYVRPC